MNPDKCGKIAAWLLLAVIMAAIFAGTAWATGWKAAVAVWTIAILATLAIELSLFLIFR